MSRDILRSSSRLSLDLSDKAPRVLRQQSKTKTATDSCKIVVVGDSKCGKSSLISSFLGHNDGEFSEKYIPTTFETYTHTLERESFTMQVGVWDTSGKSEYALMRPLSYKGTTAAVICFDVMAPETLFNAVCKWHPEITKHCPGCPIILAGCKMDLRVENKKDRCFNELTDGSVESPVSHDKGTMAASQISAQAYIECSAKTNSPGVREVFEMAALASIGKLNLQKSYVDLSSAVRRKSLSTSLQTRMRRSQSVNGSLRVRASMVEEDDDKKCAIM